MSATGLSRTDTYCPGDGETTAANPPVSCTGHQQNISETERLMSTLSGSVLLFAGLVHGKLSGLLLSLSGVAMVYRGITGHCHGYEALGIDTAEHSPAAAMSATQGVKVEKKIVVNRPPEQLYAFWRDVENLPRVMQHLHRVDAIDAKRSRWVAKGPLGTLVEWEAEIINERENELIAWRSLPGGDIDTAGSVHFKPLGHDRGSLVTISLKYNPPAGKVGAAVASLLCYGLGQQLDQDIREFRSHMEAGEVPTVAGQTHGVSF